MMTIREAVLDGISEGHAFPDVDQIGAPAPPLFDPEEIRFRRYLLSEPVAREWLLRETLPTRIAGLLAATGGAGKSRLIYQLCFSVVSAVPFVGMGVGTIGGALYLAGEDDGWHRFEVGDAGPGRRVEVKEFTDERRGTWGTGAIHHVAFRVADTDHQAAVSERVVRAGQHPTEVIDRFWFRSIYFKEPGGALFEVATDGPGFTADETLGTLGERLVLPPFLESQREAIESKLTPLGPGTTL